ncbi:MAG: ABC transporter substrate-binding protein [Candidatus Rokubacteria bacterium]|nr:ABC transporter substrate-binding protein [Candidatus Rokubacteria bacterium]
MRPRITTLTTVLAVLLLIAPVAAHAQRPAKVPVIGFLAPAGEPFAPSPRSMMGTGMAMGSPAYRDAFLQGLRELGYVEGQTVAIEYRWAEGMEQLPALAAELARLPVDVIVTVSTPAVQAAKLATTTIPIVIAIAADPVATGLVAALARPGGNITGLSTQSEDLSRKRLQLLREVVPRVTRIAVLWNPGSPIGPGHLRETEAAARALRVQLQVLEARGPEDLDGAFAAMARHGAHALVVTPDPMLHRERRSLVGLAARRQLPAIYFATDFVEVGGLMNYSADFADLARRAAMYVHKILKGAKPADLPVEQPTRFELVINLKTAKALGLTIPPALLLQADRVIE